jgi:hypothetical protein
MESNFWGKLTGSKIQRSYEVDQMRSCLRLRGRSNEFPRHRTPTCPASAGLLSTKIGHAPPSWDQPTKRNVAGATR